MADCMGHEPDPKGNAPMGQAVYCDGSCRTDDADDGDDDESAEDYADRMMDREFYGDDLDFADPGGTSALRVAGPNNPRNLPCPDCGSANRLTPRDVELGYHCDACADAVEQGGP